MFYLALFVSGFLSGIILARKYPNDASMTALANLATWPQNKPQPITPLVVCQQPTADQKAA